MKPPTVEEVRQYADKLGYAGFDAERFWDHFDMVGWVWGKGKAAKPIKNWQAAVRQWRRNDLRAYANNPTPIPTQRQRALVGQGCSCEMFIMRSSAADPAMDLCVCGFFRHAHWKEKGR